VIPGPGGGFALDLAHGQVRLRPPEAVIRLLAERRIPYRLRDDVLIVEPDAAGGAELRFMPNTRGLSAEQRLV